eukprot:SAG31_NODE_2110_length_6426_cov_6.371898_4_plen_49_part_00
MNLRLRLMLKLATLMLEFAPLTLQRYNSLENRDEAVLRNNLDAQSLQR